MSKFTIEQMMTQSVVVANTSHTFSQVIELFTNFPIRHLPVVDENNKLIGIISSNDIFKLFENPKFKGKVIDMEQLNKAILLTDLMTVDPITVSPDEDVFDVAEIFRLRKFQALPVVNSTGDLVGIVSVKDMLDYFVEKAEGIN